MTQLQVQKKKKRRPLGASKCCQRRLEPWVNGFEQPTRDLVVCRTGDIGWASPLRLLSQQASSLSPSQPMEVRARDEWPGRQPSLCPCSLPRPIVAVALGGLSGFARGSLGPGYDGWKLHFVACKENQARGLQAGGFFCFPSL